MVKVDSSWSNDQIISYLKQFWGCDDFVFDCKVSDTPIYTQTPENYKGSISNITHNGKQLSYPNSNKPIFVNIPKTVMQDIPTGKCKLRFVLLRREARLKSNNPFVIIPDYGSFRELNIDKARKIQQQRAETGKVEYSEREKDLFERWGVKDCKFIGKYTYDAERASYIVSDIRKPNFARMSYYPNDKTKSPIVIKCPAIKDIEKNELPLNEYYLFNWKFSDKNPDNPYEIHIDFRIPPQPIRAQWFIDQLFYDRYEDLSKNFDTATNFLDTLSKQLSAKDSTFIYELLQNADDYPEEEEPVDVEFHITEHYLIFLHSGAKFNIRNISGICGVNEKEKTANKKTIGYKGIGFKTVFHQNHYVYIQTGNYSFRFEEKADVIKRQEAPWPILPIWTALKDVPVEVAEIFKNADPKFRVKIALRPDDSAILHEGRLNYEALFCDLFADSNLILFTQHIRSVKVYIHNQVQRDCFIDESRWVVNDYEEAIDEELQKYINKDIETGRSRIPEKYKDFEATKVSFACRKEGRKLLPIDDAILYCYLPTSTSWGFPFLLNTDMIPKGDRNDIEREVFLKDEKETNFNFALARIAGKKFFTWIQDLMYKGLYDYDSIFALIPDFDKCIREHKDYEEFITNFRDGFNELLQSKPIVPVVEDNKTVFKPIEFVIYDTTGLSCSGMMSDKDILKLCQWQDYFPHPTLRDYSNATLKPAIAEFLATYHLKDQEFDIKNLVNCVKYDEFKDWLRNQDNNNKFLKLLVEKETIREFQYSQIFLNQECLLRTPREVYYDIDDYYNDISYFEPYLERLSIATKTLFRGNVIWDTFAFTFLNFEPNNFVNNVLLSNSNFEKVHNILLSPESAFKFMHFLAQYVDYKSSFRRFPFVDDDGSIVGDCYSKQLTYLPGEQIIELRNKPWVDSEQIAIFSSAYDGLSLDYIRENFGDMDCTTQSFIEQYICSGKYADNINDLIEDLEVNKDFVNFLFEHQEFIPDSKLAPYKVGCFNKSGDEGYGIITDNHLYLLDPKTDIHFESLPWMDDDMLDVVSEKYFTEANRQKLTLFFKDKFNIPVLNLDSYVNEILERRTADINSYLKDEQINLAFWRWTKEHYEEREKLDPIFAKFYVLAKTLDEESLDFHNIDENIFLSSAYQKSDDAEKIVTMFVQNTLFISPYMEKSNEKVKDWVDFWRKIGVKTTIEDLVFEKVIPHLDEIREDGLPNLLGEYYSQIKERWDDVKDALCKIRVKTRRDGFYNIHDAVVINVSKEKEPFKDIIISNEIDPAIIGNKNTRELLLDIAEYANAWMVNNMTDWQQYKVSNYVSNEDEYGEEIHMAFIKELALIDVETIKSFNHVDCLRLLARNGEYISPSLLTLGSLYKPECDFEKYGVECQYVSDNYYSAEAAEALVTLIRKGIFEVHYSFTSDDIESLSSYDFALYFWKDYAWSHSAEVSEWIENDLFGGVECVPTMAKTIDTPNNLYSRDISEYVVKGINKWEAKLPSDQIPKPKEGSFDMFAKLPFKDHLSFNDGIEALINIKNVGKRATILTWLRDEYTDDKEDLITAYRKDKDALWRNGKGKEVPLTELYALAPESTMLFDYFQDNEYVLPHGYLHDLTEEDYRGICSMMQIPIVEEEDMEFTPFDSVKENLGHYFEGKLLIFAAIDNPKNWTKSFANYKEKLSDLTFWKCSKIAWVYGKNEAVQQSNRKFFCQDNRFFYVGTWSGFQVSRFFLDALEDHIGLTLHRNEELFLRIMDPAAEMQELLEDYHSIKTEEFIVELNKYSSYQPEVIQIEEDDDDVYSSGYRPRTFDPELQREQTSPDYDNPYEDEDNELQYEDVDTPTDDSPRPARETNPIRATERRRPEHVEHPRVQPKQVEVAHDGTYSGSDAPEEKNPISNTPRRPHAPAEPGERRAMNGSSHSPREPYSPNPDAIKSEGIPVELATLEMGVAEEADLRRILNGMSSDAIANNAYLANYRLFKQIENWKQEHPEYDIEPEESEADFIRNIPKEGGVISDHRLKSGKFMRACSAAGGVLYLSPGIWNMVADNRCVLCIYRGADNNRVANEFLLIKSYDELLQFIGHDDLLVKITGEHRVKIIEFLYNNLNSKVTRGTVYSLIRVAESTPINSAMASVSAAMTEQEDEDSKFYDL